MKKRLFLGIICSLVFGISAMAAESGIFRDVPSNHWASDSVYELVKMGVTKGYPDGTYRGERNISRYETAVFMANLANALKKDLVKSEIDELAITKLVERELNKKIEAKGAAVSGQLFMQYEKGVQNSSVVNNFNITRAYLNISNAFADNVKAKVVLDAARANANTSFNEFVKYAYVDILDVMPQGVFFSMTHNLRLGQQPTYWPTFTDGLLGLRYISRSLTDRNGMVSTSDLGVGAYGTANLGFLPQLNYTLMAVNGTGFTAAENNAGKDIEGRVDTEIMPGLILAAGGRVKDVGASSTGAKLANIAAAYTVENNGLSLEYGYGQGLAAFSVAGKYEIMPAISVLGRYDSYDPNRGTSNDEQTTIIAGGAYQIRNNVKLALDYQGTSYGSAASVNAGQTVGTAYLHSQIDF